MINPGKANENGLDTRLVSTLVVYIKGRCLTAKTFLIFAIIDD